MLGVQGKGNEHVCSLLLCKLTLYPGGTGAGCDCLCIAAVEAGLFVEFA
jgi:hypothetical protein